MYNYRVKTSKGQYFKIPFRSFTKYTSQTLNYHTKNED